MALGAGGAGHGDFAFGMKGLLSAHRREHKWRTPLRPEYLHGHVDVFYVHEPACAYLYPRVAFAIRAHRSVIVHTCGEIAEMSWRQRFACSSFKIHHFECLVRR